MEIDVVYKVKNPKNIIFSILGTLLIGVSVAAIYQTIQKGNSIVFLFIILFPFLIGVDMLFDIARTITIKDGQISLKLFGKIIKHENIENIKFDKKLYGVKRITHRKNSDAKSIVMNGKYFCTITGIDSKCKMNQN